MEPVNVQIRVKQSQGGNKRHYKKLLEKMDNLEKMMQMILASQSTEPKKPL